MSMSSSTGHVLLSLLFCFLLQKPSQAIKQSYIVYLGPHSHGLSPSSLDVESITNNHYDLLGSYVGSTKKAKEAIFYSYTRYFNGFAAILDEDEAAQIAKNPNVVSIFLNKVRKLHTTHSWDFMGLERNGAIPNDSVWSKSQGDGVIIANLDTGVWPESKSFNDEGFGPVPKRWSGICQVDKNNTDNFHCNRKLIGARYFGQGYLADAKQLNITLSINGARDTEGHGSHTLSTAGGNLVVGASVFGNGNGTARGGSPKARVAAYKVCWPGLGLLLRGGCYDSDILAGFEAAISDGVDVISVSLGGQVVEYSESSISIGSFHAVANGITVVCSAGNSGPLPSSVTNVEPWIVTVAANTVDRDFTSHVALGNKKILKGASLSEFGLPPHKLYPLISAADAKAANASTESALLCMKEALDSHKAKGKILVCLRGQNARIDKGIEVARAGGVGMILVNDKLTANGIIADPHLLPASHVSFAHGSYIFKYINSTKSPLAYISRVKTELGVTPAPVVASFSSRGPNSLEPSLLKPDITAPGVNMIAAYTEAISPTEQPSDKRRTPFMTMSGTSMSCPHVSGVVGLLKSVHPGWSPAAIKSAIITTATTNDNTKSHILDSTLEKSTPFAIGAGHIRPNLAVSPGLVYDLDITDYLNVLCARGYSTSQLKLFYGKPYTCPKSFNLADFNYPSISIPDLKIGHALNITRTVTNVGSPGTYKVFVDAPPEVLVSVKPKRLRFKKKGQKKKFKVTFTLRKQASVKTDYGFGSLDWTDRRHHVRSPIVVKYSHL